MDENFSRKSCSSPSNAQLESAGELLKLPLSVLAVICLSPPHTCPRQRRGKDLEGIVAERSIVEERQRQLYSRIFLFAPDEPGDRKDQLLERRRLLQKLVGADNVSVHVRQYDFVLKDMREFGRFEPQGKGRLFRLRLLCLAPSGRSASPRFLRTIIRSLVQSFSD